MKLLVEGTLIINPSEDDVKAARDPSYLVTIEGDSVSVTITPVASGTTTSIQILSGEVPSQSPARTTKDVQARVHVVLDQMFKGFSDVLERELPENIHINEVLGKGLESPISTGRVTKWPARDDYDVYKIVEGLADKSVKVLFFTGDKRLARQVASIGRDNIVVEYLPPNEFPGKESIIEKILAVTMSETRR